MRPGAELGQAPGADLENPGASDRGGKREPRWAWLRRVRTSGQGQDDEAGLGRRLWRRVRGRRSGRRWAWRIAWLRDWRTLKSTAAGWWYSSGAHDVRVAWRDTRRAPRLLLFGYIAVMWTLTDFALDVVLVPVGLWVLMMLVTRRRVHWSVRRRIRRYAQPVIGLAALGWLTWQAGLWAWFVATSVWLFVAASTDRFRARRRVVAWLLHSIARGVGGRVDEGQLNTSHREWDGTRLLHAEVVHNNVLRLEDQAVRTRIENTVEWSLRHAGRYRVTWPAGVDGFEVHADPALPEMVEEPMWPHNLPAIPLAVTSEENAHYIYEERDENTGQTTLKLPIVAIDPRKEQKHLLVIGGTGAGKSVFTRGYIARGIELGWWPGGVFIYDGKGGSDYIVFEDREGVHYVARDPEEWEQKLTELVEFMRKRYDLDAKYHQGKIPKPDFAPFLVVWDEFQEIRAALGKKVCDPIVQKLSRQIRQALGRLMVVTQRPDVEDAIPGAVRDMLEERVVLGFVSRTGAQMALGDDWRQATDAYGAGTVPGRGVARLGGKTIPIQSLYLGAPIEDRKWEKHYPPKRGKGGKRTPRDREPAPNNVRQLWATGAPPTPDSAHIAPNTPTPPRGIPVIGQGPPRPAQAPPGRPALAEDQPTDRTPPPGEPGQEPPRRTKTV